MPEVFYTPLPEADFQVKYGPKPMHAINIRIPEGKGPHPTLLVIHGGSWKSAYYFKQTEYICEDFTKIGIATCNIEYSRVGHVNGGWPGTFKDLVCAVNTINELANEWNLDTENIVLLGHSSGAHLAFWLAAVNKLSSPELKDTKISMKFSAVVSLTGVLDLEDAWNNNILRKEIANLLNGTSNELPELYKVTSPAELFPLDCKQVLMHGTRDRLLPYYLSENYYNKAKSFSEDVSLFPIVGCAHFKMIDPTSKYWPEIRNIVSNLFNGRPKTAIEERYIQKNLPFSGEN
jgi:acetyl esterase/lipase